MQWNNAFNFSHSHPWFLSHTLKIQFGNGKTWFKSILDVISIVKTLCRLSTDAALSMKCGQLLEMRAGAQKIPFCAKSTCIHFCVQSYSTCITLGMSLSILFFIALGKERFWRFIFSNNLETTWHSFLPGTAPPASICRLSIKNTYNHSYLEKEILKFSDKNMIWKSIFYINTTKKWWS